jgi:Fur family ferric uptake transcriptional regulator
MTDKKPRRSTRQRRVILEELQKLTSHPTAVGLYEIVRKRLPKLSLGTVYRNLELLAQDGVIQKLELSGTESRFDGNPAQHDHVRCVRCGRVDDVHGLPAKPPWTEVKHLGGYKIVGCRVEFIGVCRDCQATFHAEDPPRPNGAED